MHRTMFSCVIQLVTFSCLLQSVSGCSLDIRGWKELSVEQMMERVDLAVVGTDLRHIVTNNRSGGYNSEFLVTCVLKGDLNDINERIIIYNMYDNTAPCFFSQMTPGNDYIVGLQRFRDGYQMHQVNVPQGATFPYTTDNIERARRSCGSESFRLPDGSARTENHPFCYNPYAGGECISGQWKNVPSSGIVLAAFISCVVLMNYFSSIYQR